MADHLPFVMHRLLNVPLAMSVRDAEIVVAALAGRLSIQSLERTFETRSRGTVQPPMALGPAELAKLAAVGRMQADQGPVRRWQAGKAVSNPTPSAVPEQYQKSFEQVDDVAIIHVWGVLTRTWGVGPYSGSTGYDGIQIQIIEAMEDDSVNAIWLDINSGGGAVDGIFDLVDLIWACNAKNGGKTIFAMAADYAYSAAFAIATAADKVLVPQTGGVGSVGVITMHADLTQAYENEGIKVTVMRSGARKAIGAFGMSLDQEEIDHWQGQLDVVRDIFVDRVARNMGLSKIKVSQTEGLDYMGEAAKAIGFVTDVASEHQAWMKLRSRLDRSS